MASIPKNLNITKLIYLAQGWAPGAELFQDSLVFGDAINCASRVDLFETNDCLSFKWNYPNYVSSMPPWQFWWIVYLILFFLSYVYVIIQIYGLLKKMKHNVLGMVLIISPPFLYAIERGSLDIQVAAALFYLYKFNYKRLHLATDRTSQKSIFASSKVTLISCLIFTYLSIIKFYPIIFFVLAIFAVKKFSRVLVVVFFALNIVLSWLWLDAPKFLLINNPYNDFLPIGALNYFRFVIEKPIILVLLVAGLFIIKKKGYKLSILQTNSFNFFTYLPLLIFMSFWLIAGSASYRTIFLLVFLVLYRHERTMIKGTDNSTIKHNSSQDSEITFFIICILFTTGMPIICNTLILFLFMKLTFPLILLFRARVKSNLFSKL